MRFGFPHLDKHSLVSWALFRLSPPIDKRIKGVVVKLTHCHSENKWLEMHVNSYSSRKRFRAAHLPRRGTHSACHNSSTISWRNEYACQQKASSLRGQPSRKQTQRCYPLLDFNARTIPKPPLLIKVLLLPAHHLQVPLSLHTPKPIKNLETAARTVSIRNYGNSKGTHVHSKGEIKTTVRYHHTPSTMANTKNIDNTKCWRGAEEQGLSYIAERKTKWYNCFGKLFGSVY